VARKQGYRGADAHLVQPDGRGLVSRVQVSTLETGGSVSRVWGFGVAGAN